MLNRSSAHADNVWLVHAGANVFAVAHGFDGVYQEPSNYLETTAIMMAHMTLVSAETAITW